MSNTRIRSWSILASCLLAGVLVACGDDDDGVAGTGGSAGIGGEGGMAGAAGTGGEAGTTADARVRALHLSPDAPAVDVFVDDSTSALFSEVSFPESSDYIDVPAGTYDLDIAPAGMTAGDSVLAVDGVELQGDASYTAVAFDELAEIQALTLVDAYGDLAEGDIRVRAVHTAVGVGEVDVWNVTDPGAPAPLYEDVGFGDAGDPMDLPAGQYAVGLDVDDDAVVDFAFELPELDAGAVVNLFAVADDEGNPFLLAQFADSSTIRIDPREATGFIRVLHLSPDAPAMDVFADDAEDPTVSDLAFPDGTGYLALPVASYDFDVAPAGMTAAESVLAIDDFMIEEGTYYTAVAFDELADIQALPLEDDYADLAEGDVRVRAIHAAVGVGQVDIWNIPDDGDPTPLYEDVDFGVAGAATDLPAGAYTLGIDVDDDATSDLTFELPELEAGTFANVYAVSDDQDDVFLLVQMRDGSTVRVDPES